MQEDCFLWIAFLTAGCAQNRAGRLEKVLIRRLQSFQVAAAFVFAAKLKQHCAVHLLGREQYTVVVLHAAPC